MLLSKQELYRFDGFELDPRRRILSRDDDPISLTPKAFDVLSYLVLNPGRVVTKDELLKAVWPDSLWKKATWPSTSPRCAGHWGTNPL
jgi:DNA-binding winged helix-turn-helix (wHTH) protein